MRNLALFALFFAVSNVADAALPVGAKAPDFVTQAAKAGTPFTYVLERARKNGPVVIYFFPAAFTPGCTVEAHAFAEASKTFDALGASILGVAGDDIAKLARFSVEECQSKFPVGVATSAMIRGFDVALPLTGRTSRTSYLISPDGTVAKVWSNPDYRGHVPAMLNALRQLKRKSR
jgi:thioredoxin-dependent peroxiredoxin